MDKKDLVKAVSIHAAISGEASEKAVDFILEYFSKTLKNQVKEELNKLFKETPSGYRFSSGSSSPRGGGFIPPSPSM